MSDTFDQLFVGIDHVGCAKEGRPIDLFLKLGFEFKIANLVAVGVEVKHSIESDGFLGNYIAAYRGVGLEPAGSTDAYHGELLKLRFDGAGLKINVCQRIQFG